MAVNEMRWGILYCPKRGMFSSGLSWNRVEKCLKENGIEFDFIQSENTGSVDRLIKMLINNGYKTIVIIGGDSALNDAVNSLMQVDKATRESVALGVIPNGLMNDFAHFWGLKEGEIETTIKSLKKRRIRKIDLGYIRYNNKKGEICRRYFLNCINIGLIATIMNLRRQTRRLFGSRTLSFIFSFILLIFQRLEYKMRLKINEDVLERSIMTICIGNATGYGQTPNAVPYNGLLDVSVVYHPEMAQLFEGIYLFLRGKFLNHRSVHPYRTRKIELSDISRAQIGIDGRSMNTPTGAFTVEVEQEVINFIIPG